ncbi:MAG: GH1 family beta-glucosidase [Pseudorhodoplanes sp.]
MPEGISRRALGAGAALGLAGAAWPAAAQDTGGAASKRISPPQFPQGFIWGVATAAYQIEGSPDADGKGKSIWDSFSHMPGKIANGDTGDVANDHYRLYKRDVAMMKEIGAKAYRFSIAWPRVFPEGAGAENSKGLDFYNRLVDELLEVGIEPYATLYHWDLPQALQDKYGGWQSSETAKAFGDYSGHVAKALSDRVRNFFTINEFSVFVELGHRGIDTMSDGKPVRIEHAPGLRLSSQALNQVRHHAVLGHGMAVQAIRAFAQPGTRVGLAENVSIAVPVIENAAHIEAAERATRDQNAPYLGVILEGKYNDGYLAAAGKDAPRFTDEDLRLISSPLDFVGLNVYRPSTYVEASDQSPGYRVVPENASHPRMAAPWQLLGPEVLYWGPRLLQSIWDVKEIYITENGCAASDVVAADGTVSDSDRVMYLRNAMMQLQRATAEGMPVKGNFVWSLMDNFEWADGYSRRFGLVHVDFATQKRTPKLSAAWFRAAAAANAVV